MNDGILDFENKRNIETKRLGMQTNHYQQFWFLEQKKNHGCMDILGRTIFRNDCDTFSKSGNEIQFNERPETASVPIACITTAGIPAIGTCLNTVQWTNSQCNMDSRYIILFIQNAVDSKFQNAQTFHNFVILSCSESINRQTIGKPMRCEQFSTTKHFKRPKKKCKDTPAQTVWRHAPLKVIGNQQGMQPLRALSFSVQRTLYILQISWLDCIFNHSQNENTTKTLLKQQKGFKNA